MPYALLSKIRSIPSDAEKLVGLKVNPRRNEKGKVVFSLQLLLLSYFFYYGATRCIRSDLSGGPYVFEVRASAYVAI